MEYKLVDIAKYGFAAEPRYFFHGWNNLQNIKTRKSVAIKLKEAKKLLPLKYNFKVWDGHRTIETQILMLNSFYKRIKSAHPNWNKQRIKQETLKFGAQPVKIVKELDTHRNGGALDLTIIDRNGSELYMGTDHDDLTAKAALDYFERKNSLSILDKHAQKNRKLLKKVMIKSGFKPYLAEWWHWSYDK